MLKKYFKIYIFFCTISIQAIVNAQPIGNEWIDYNRKYYRIDVVSDGIHRINFSVLQAAGVLSGNPNPRSFQIFGRGIEQHIYVKGEEDGVFDANDYIEFYGKKNDGWLDAYIYDKPSSQGNTDYSLFTDTASYYLTFNPNWVVYPSKRMTLHNNFNFSSYTPSPFVFATVME